MKVIGIAAMVLLAAGAALEGIFTAAQQPPVTTIEDAKAESVRIQHELVELNDRLAVAPPESQTAPIGETTLTLCAMREEELLLLPWNHLRRV